MMHNQTPHVPDWPSVDVWWIDLTRPPNLDALGEADLDRARRFARPDLSRRFLARRAARRVILSQYCRCRPRNLRFEKEFNGKPLLSVKGLHFNASSSGDLAVIAVSSRKIGIDVERIRFLSDMAVLIDRICSADERAHLSGLGEPERTLTFFRYWAAKEADVKLSGEGFSADLKRAGNASGVIRLDAPDGFAAALAAKMRPVPVYHDFHV